VINGFKSSIDGETRSSDTVQQIEKVDLSFNIQCNLDLLATWLFLRLLT